jgi:hypothetical protein
MQNPDQVILIRPANFGFNSETAISNKFQREIEDHEAQAKALVEFNEFVKKLNAENIKVSVFEDTLAPIKPDAIFPNNWISVHPNGTIVLYPMEATNRRLERRKDVVKQLENIGFTTLIDLTAHENEGRYLEGTGSIIFDPNYSDAYACISSRTDVKLFEQVCRELNYNPISFLAEDVNGDPIYHTNVMLSIGEKCCIICSESIANPIERAMVLSKLKNSKRVVIDVSFQQMNHFACNCLEVNDQNGHSKLIMSTTAYNSFSFEQLEQIESQVKIIHVSIPTIETIGGGSARCMLLGVFSL